MNYYKNFITLKPEKIAEKYCKVLLTDKLPTRTFCQGNVKKYVF